jgi:hypothetical protein
LSPKKELVQSDYIKQLSSKLNLDNEYTPKKISFDASEKVKTDISSKFTFEQVDEKSEVKEDSLINKDAEDVQHNINSDVDFNDNLKEKIETIDVVDQASVVEEVDLNKPDSSDFTETQSSSRCLIF